MTPRQKEKWDVIVANERAKAQAIEDAMKLPEGKTCALCVYANRCVKMFGGVLTNTVCDFSPCRFFPKDDSI